MGDSEDFAFALAFYEGKDTVLSFVLIEHYKKGGHLCFNRLFFINKYSVYTYYSNSVAF